MTDADLHPALTRPIWSALNADHAGFSIRHGSALGYGPAYGQFRASERYDQEALHDLAALSRDEAVVSFLEPEPVDAPHGFEASHVPVVQFLATEFPERACTSDIIPLGREHADAMLALALLTKPGPFRLETYKLGQFFGVFEGGDLIAMGGTRMAFDPFVEVSGVCTHPAFRGRGLGAALICRAGRAIQDRGKRPFLHANADNEIAKGLYRSLEFRETRHLWHSIWTRQA